MHRPRWAKAQGGRTAARTSVPRPGSTHPMHTTAGAHPARPHCRAAPSEEAALGAQEGDSTPGNHSGSHE